MKINYNGYPSFDFNSEDFQMASDVHESFKTILEKMYKSHSRIKEDFMRLHMEPLLPPRYRNKVYDPKWQRRIARWISKEGYHTHTQGDWFRLVRGKCKIGEIATCEVIASLYIEIK